MLPIERLRLELEDVKQDLDVYPLNIPNCKIGDFGCGWGYGTMGLMLLLNASEGIGVSMDDVWLLGTFEEAQPYFNTARDYPRGTQDILQKIRQLLDKGCWPKFLKEDVLNNQNLPKDLDLAYCKLLLENICNDKVNDAINNIVGCLKPDGILCIIDRVVLDFTEVKRFPSLTKLEFLRDCRFQRPLIGSQGRQPISEYFRIYFYQKI